MGVGGGAVCERYVNGRYSVAAVTVIYTVSRKTHVGVVNKSGDEMQPSQRSAKPRVGELQLKQTGHRKRIGTTVDKVGGVSLHRYDM